MFQQNDEVGTSRIARWIALVVVIAVASVTVAIVRTPDAEALNDFDTELLVEINKYRTALQLSPLTDHAPLSRAAIKWSEKIRTELDFHACNNTNPPHDTQENVNTQGTLAGTVSIVEHVKIQCGVVGISYAQSCGRECFGTPRAHCNLDRDRTNPVDQFCELVMDPVIRDTIENPDLTHIGVGTMHFDDAGALTRRHLFTTIRVADFGAVCDGRPVTVNMITGQGRATNGPDVILGTPGNDRIRGFGGNDVICAGSGVDHIYAGDGDDIIFGEGGSDFIRAQGGFDTVVAGSGADRVWGGPGNDNISGNGGKDRLWGDDGNDVIQGNWQTDIIHGGAGNDVLRGAGGKDKIYGGEGDDQLFGGFNTDYLNGGPGNDTGNGQQGKDNPLVADRSGCELLETAISC